MENKIHRINLSLFARNFTVKLKDKFVKLFWFKFARTIT